jgi:hypothetical protein
VRQKFLIIIVLIIAGLSNYTVAQSRNNKKASTKAKTNRPTEPTTPKPKRVRKTDKPLPITKEFNTGFAYNSDGWGVGFQRLELRSEPEKHVYQGFFIELAEQRDSRERKTSPLIRDSNGINNRYYYGKQFNNYQVKLGYMIRRPLSGKLDHTHIRLQWLMAAAMNLNIYKPYFLRFSIPGIGIKEDRYLEENADYFTDKTLIYGASGFNYGWNYLQYGFGMLGRTGIQFEYAPNKYNAVIFELGTELKSTFGTGLSTMVNTKVRMVDPMVYLAVRFAKLYE